MIWELNTDPSPFHWIVVIRRFSTLLKIAELFRIRLVIFKNFFFKSCMVVTKIKENLRMCKEYKREEQQDQIGQYPGNSTVHWCCCWWNCWTNKTNILDLLLEIFLIDVENLGQEIHCNITKNIFSNFYNFAKAIVEPRFELVNLRTRAQRSYW